MNHFIKHLMIQFFQSQTMGGKNLPAILKMLGADDGHMGLYENRIKTFRNWIFPGEKFLLNGVSLSLPESNTMFL